MKKIEDINTTAKEINDAMTSFTGNLTRTYIEANTKVWEEMIKFTETTTKLTSDMIKEIPLAKGFVNPWFK